MSEQNYLPPYSVLMSVYSKEKASFLEEAIQSIFCKTILVLNLFWFAMALSRMNWMR